MIPIYDAGEADGRVYIAMRLVPGTDLRLLLRREGPLEPARALAIVGQAADALDAAHARGLLHRDVKPANILLASDGRAGTDEHVYLSDFGLAVSGSGESRLERGGFQGTPDYVAPEQIEGRPEPRSDLYALACVLFECLTGEPPFGRGRLLETLWRHLNEDPSELSERRPDWPAGVDAVFAAALAKDPGERPVTCNELVSRARTALGLDRPLIRSRARLAAALAAVAVIATAVASTVVLREQGGRRGAAVESKGATIVTFAGTGESGSSGNGGPAADAKLAEPFSVAVDPAGDVYVSEARGGRVRRIDPKGVITTVAGTGEAASVGKFWDPARPDLG